MQLYLSFMGFLSSTRRVCLVGLGFRDDLGSLVRRCVVVAFVSHHTEQGVKSFCGTCIDVC